MVISRHETSVPSSDLSLKINCSLCLHTVPGMKNKDKKDVPNIDDPFLANRTCFHIYIFLSPSLIFSCKIETTKLPKKLLR